MIQVFLVLLIIFLVVFDQISKVIASGALINSPIEIIKGVFELRYEENSGCAWSLLSDKTELLIIFTSIILIALVIILFSGKIKNKFGLISLALIISGGIGNLIDRIFRGYVIDFFYVKCINFPIFNVADSFVCIGAVLLLIYVIFFYDEKETSKRSNDDEESGIDSSSKE